MREPYDPFPDEGKIRTFLKSFDWSGFSLGTLENWPSPLKTAFQIMLDSSEPTCLLWGAALVFFYNNGFRKFLGSKHPAVFARPFRESGFALQGNLLEDLDKVLQGVPIFRTNVEFQLVRRGHLQSAWFTYSLLPIRGDDGNVVGVLVTCTETSKEVESERRQAFQLALADRLRPLNAPEDIVATASEMLGRQLDVSRVMYCEIDDANGTFFIRRDWTNHGLASIAGVVRRMDDFGPEIVDVLRRGQPMIVDDVTVDPRTASHAEAYVKLGVRANLAISLIRSGQMTTVLSLNNVSPRHWTACDIQHAEDMAERTWWAVENARVQAELRIERDRSQSIFDSMTEGFVLFDRDWTILRANAEGLRILHQAGSDVVGRHHWEIWPELKDTRTETLCAEVKDNRVAGVIEDIYTLPGGERKWLEVRAYPAMDGGLAIFFRDITQRKEADEALRCQSEKLRLATEAAELGLFDHNLTSGELNWNPTLRDQFNVPPEEKISWETMFDRIHPDDRQRVQRTVDLMLARGGTGRYQSEYRIVIDGGEERWISARGQVFCDAVGWPVRMVGTTMDITERVCAEKQIQEAIQHDSLTRLPNRALLYDYCSHILAMSARTGDPGAILFIDLDRFKPINDMYGHDVGDKVLQVVADRLTSCSRKEDFVSRLGGDEFIVVLPRISAPDDPATAAQHMIMAISPPIEIGELQLNVSPSIGISLFPQHGKDTETLIRCADMAMYTAKNSGRNNFKIFNNDFNERENGVLRLEFLLRRALEDNRLVLFYQPILNLLSRELRSVEALIRVPSEDGTLLAPTDFISVAETAGLMDRVGQWVIREACRQHRHWCEAGFPPITIAVNVSPTQFRKPGFVSVLEDAIAEFDMDAGYLQLEVTESAAMDNVPQTVSTLQHLQSMGIKIALDDFGTGYSSLSHLSILPLNKLKIDQSFIQKMATDKHTRSITKAIIGLGKALNLKVTGEGVESEDSMATLRAYGCDYVQGFLFSEPLPANEFERWYRNHLHHTAGYPVALVG